MTKLQSFGYMEKTRSSGAQLNLLLLVVLIAFIGISISYPILAPLFLNDENNKIIPLAWSHNTRSIILGITISLYPLGQFLGAPIIGRLSDQYGRKPVLIYTLCGAGIGFILTAFSLYQKSIVLLILSRLITGFLESNIIIVRAASSDIVTENKYKSFGKITATATTGTVLGPIIGGTFSDSSILFGFNYCIPFCLAAFISLIAATIIFVFFRETLPLSRRIKRSKQHNCNIVYKIERLSNVTCFKKIIFIWILVTIASDMFNQFFPAFLVGKWHMSPFYVSLYNSVLSLCYVISSACIIPYLAKRIVGITSIKIGIVIFSITLPLMLIPDKSYCVLILLPIFEIANSMILVNFFIYISDMAKKEHQGEVLGIAFGFRTLSNSIIGLAGGLLLTISPQATLVASVVINFIAVATFFIINIEPTVWLQKHESVQYKELEEF